MKRTICCLAALVLLLLSTVSFADGCEHRVDPSEWLLKGYVDPQPGIDGYSGDFCCPICGAVMKKGQPIAALDSDDPEEKKEHGQEDPVPVPFVVGAEAPAAGELIWSPDNENTFTVPNVIPAKGIEEFIGEWHYFRFVKEDGTEISREEMLAE